MISVIAEVSVKAGSMPEFLTVFKALVPTVRAENGCIEYFPALDAETPFPTQSRDGNRVVIVEKWQSLDALRAHLEAPHMTAYREKVKDMVEQVALKVLREA